MLPAVRYLTVDAVYDIMNTYIGIAPAAGLPVRRGTVSLRVVRQPQAERLRGPRGCLRDRCSRSPAAETGGRSGGGLPSAATRASSRTTDVFPIPSSPVSSMWPCGRRHRQHVRNAYGSCSPGALLLRAVSPVATDAPVDTIPLAAGCGATFRQRALRPAA